MLTKVAFKLLSFTEFLDVDGNTKLRKVLHKTKYKKEIANKINIDANQINFEAYYTCNSSQKNSNINRDSTISEFVKNSGVILINIIEPSNKQGGVEVLQLIHVLSFKEKQLDTATSKVDQAIERMKCEHENELKRIDKKHHDFLNEMRNIFTSSIEEKKKEIEGYEAVFRLSGYITEFREHIIEYINEQDGTHYSTWLELSTNVAQLDVRICDFINTIENDTIRFDDWDQLKTLAHVLNDLKHNLVDLNDADKYLDLVKYTKYKNYETALRHLVEYFKLQ